MDLGKMLSDPSDEVGHRAVEMRERELEPETHAPATRARRVVARAANWLTLTRRERYLEILDRLARIAGNLHMQV